MYIVQTEFLLLSVNMEKKIIDRSFYFYKFKF
jgi:hypothetical protein